MSSDPGENDSPPVQSSTERSWKPWLLWGLFILGWTGALLSSFIVEVGGEVLPSKASFLFGKFLHVAAYATLTILTARLPVSLRQRWLFLLLVSSHAFGTEYVQQFVGRFSSLRDVGLNHIGIFLGMALSFSCWKPWGSGS